MSACMPYMHVLECNVGPPTGPGRISSACPVSDDKGPTCTVAFPSSLPIVAKSWQKDM